MDFHSYQEQALISDRVPLGHPNALIVPLLGLAGEAGQLLTEYKKLLRDGPAHKLVKERVTEELGDLLWYIANVASKFDLELSNIAQSNLEKCNDRWGGKNELGNTYCFDPEYPIHEQLPRCFEVEIREVIETDAVKMRAFVDGRQAGDDLTDNAYLNDGYRFHDVFHLAYVAILGWSPVTRQNLKRKRKSNPKIDEVEDGGRAIAIEEGIAALVFDYARKHDFLENVSFVDYGLLKTIKELTSHLEVSVCGLGDWERAILSGYEVWRQIEKNKGGRVIVNMDTRSIAFRNC